MYWYLTMHSITHIDTAKWVSIHPIYQYIAVYWSMNCFLQWKLSFYRKWLPEKPSKVVRMYTHGFIREEIILLLVVIYLLELLSSDIFCCIVILLTWCIDTLGACIIPSLVLQQPINRGLVVLHIILAIKVALSCMGASLIIVW